jgi:cobalt-zinc-cadmium efflux system outer membrane protein
MIIMKTLLVPVLLGIGWFNPAVVFAEAPLQWTLNRSIQRAIEVAPEIKITDAEISKQKSNLEQAGAWPNPSVSIQADNKLGLDDSSGGYDLTQVSISQPLPFSRLTFQRQQAEAELAKARAFRNNEQLRLEYEIAKRFHTLQLAQAKLVLAKKRLQQANSYQNDGRKLNTSDRLVRYLTPLEVMRLDIVLQTAKQSVDIAEGEFNEASSSFKALLNIINEERLNLSALNPVTLPAELKNSKSLWLQHPALEAGKQAILSATTGIDVAKSQRFDDPVVTLFQEKDYLAGRKQNATGIMLSVQLPLWNQNNGPVKKAKAAVYQAKSELDFKQRELKTSLDKSYLHLGHLIKQAEHYQNKILQPAKKVFDLTRKGFAAGELNILTLIDANNTYFNAQARYLELLQLGWLELADVRKFAGFSLLAAGKTTHYNEAN